MLEEHISDKSTAEKPQTTANRIIYIQFKPLSRAADSHAGVNLPWLGERAGQVTRLSLWNADDEQAPRSGKH
jgi:hypothetical protein